MMLHVLCAMRESRKLLSIYSLIARLLENDWRPLISTGMTHCLCTIISSLQEIIITFPSSQRQYW
jgi:hypothetical protein